MEQNKPKHRGHLMERFAGKATTATGSTPAFLIALGLVIGWAITGPFFHYSETWQLVINTGTTIITFLMVFLIQKAQNKDSLAIQLKLNELVASHELASNRLVNVEGLSEDELRVLKEFYCNLSELTKKDVNLRQSHSIEESEWRHERKKSFHQKNSRKEPSQKPNQFKAATKTVHRKPANGDKNFSHGSPL